MAADASSILQQVDSHIEHVLSGWDIYTTVIFLVLITYLIYPFFFYTEPDIHPLLLVRQSTASPVRQPGESAIFRCLETPHGYPLKTGLGVKDAGAPKWQSGRDGDLRDVWKRALSGPADGDGKPLGEPGKVLTVLGKEEIIEYSFEKMTAEINAVGQHMKGHGGIRVAIYLPNSVELLVTLFAATFYGLTPILVPQDQSLDMLAGILTETKADVLVAGAGAVPLNELLRHYPSLKQVIWVVERTSRHMDWNEVPEGAGGKADIAAWHDIIDEKGSTSAELPTEVPGGTLPNIIMVAEDSMSAFDSYEVVEFTQKNLVAAIGSQISVLPRTHRLAPTDLLTPLASLTEMYPLTVTLAALFSNASLALTPVSGPKVPYGAAFAGMSPTIVIAGSQTMSTYCKNMERVLLTNQLGIHHWWKSSYLESGAMPKPSTAPQKPRLVYTYNNAAGSTVKLSPSELFNLRVFTGARFIYAFTDSHVAGAVSQTNMLDYRNLENSQGEHSHFGPPLGCVEFRLKDTEDGKNEDGKPLGQLAVGGPAVVGGVIITDRIMRVTDENTLIYP